MIKIILVNNKKYENIIRSKYSKKSTYKKNSIVLQNITTRIIVIFCD